MQGHPALSLPQHPVVVGPSPCHLPRFGDPPSLHHPKSFRGRAACTELRASPSCWCCGGDTPSSSLLRAVPSLTHPSNCTQFPRKNGIFKESHFFLPISLLAPCLQLPGVTPAPRSKGSASPRATRGEGCFILATSPVLEQCLGLRMHRDLQPGHIPPGDGTDPAPTPWGGSGAPHWVRTHLRRC